MAATSLNAEELQSAFELFNHQSGVPETSYRRLQSRVATLTTELKVAQAECLSERVAKDMLGQQLSELQQRQERLMAIGESHQSRDCGMPRRAFLGGLGTGCASIALSAMLQRESRAAAGADWRPPDGMPH